MKILTIFLLAFTLLSFIFWRVDGPGSGMGGVTLALAIGTVLVLLFNKWRTGAWLSDTTPPPPASPLS